MFFILRTKNKIGNSNDSLLEIVDIQFTFKHFRLIPLMIQRGKAIWDQNTVKRLEIEKKILYEYSSKYYNSNNHRSLYQAN